MARTAYEVHVNERGTRFAGDPKYENPLRFVGLERFHTHVSRVSRGAADRLDEVMR